MQEKKKIGKKQNQTSKLARYKHKNGVTILKAMLMCSSI